MAFEPDSADVGTVSISSQCLKSPIAGNLVGDQADGSPARRDIKRIRTSVGITIAVDRDGSRGGDQNCATAGTAVVAQTCASRSPDERDNLWVAIGAKIAARQIKHSTPSGAESRSTTENWPATATESARPRFRQSS